MQPVTSVTPRQATPGWEREADVGTAGGAAPILILPLFGETTACPERSRRVEILIWQHNPSSLSQMF